jgi:hypothetical protein
MRRLIVGLACVAAAAAAEPQPAAAKGTVGLRSTPPAGLRAGDTWNAELVVHASAKEIAAADPPTVLIHNRAAGWTEIPATPVPGRRGVYRAVVVFPETGGWTYHVHDPIAGGGYDFEPIVVAPPSGRGDWLASPLLVGSMLAVAAAVGAAMIARLRRVGHVRFL